jgi:5'-deoxynucleotidase
VPKRISAGPEALLELFTRAGGLKGERRKGWVRKLAIPNPESVADHSFRTALMAMVYSDLRGLDTGKTVRMALLHDLPEALVGDTVPGERTRAQKLRLESRAMKEMLAGLPKAQGREYWEIWQEFNRGSSKEAALVREVDKLEMAVQADEYRKGQWKAHVSEFMESARNGIDDEELLSLLALLGS